MKKLAPPIFSYSPQRKLNNPDSKIENASLPRALARIILMNYNFSAWKG